MRSMARILPIAVAEGNVAEGGPMATVGSTCQHSEKNEKGKSIRLWNSILKPKITGKQFKKRPKNAKMPQPTEDQKNAECR